MSSMVKYCALGVIAGGGVHLATESFSQAPTLTSPHDEIYNPSVLNGSTIPTDLVLPNRGIRTHIIALYPPCSSFSLITQQIKQFIDSHPGLNVLVLSANETATRKEFFGSKNVSFGTFGRNRVPATLAYEAAGIYSFDTERKLMVPQVTK